jgi:hypothetical protein
MNAETRRKTGKRPQMNTDEHKWRTSQDKRQRGTPLPSIGVHLCSSVARLLCLCCLGLGVLPGCNLLPTGLADESVGAFDRPFPQQLVQEEVLDIQVIRGPETTITMTNTTARSFGMSTLWLNGRFSRPIEGFKPGQTLSLNLYDFRDEFGEEFRGGGFFATKHPEQLMHAQLETFVDGEIAMLGLVVVGESQ